MIRFALRAIVGAAVAGCASTNAASVVGACKAFRPAPYAVKADTPTGQVWVSGTIEAQHRVCGFPRPGGKR